MPHVLMCNCSYRSLRSRFRIRQLLFLTIIWTIIMYMLSHLFHYQGRLTFINVRVDGRTLLKPLVDYGFEESYGEASFYTPSSKLKHVESMKLLLKNSNLPAELTEDSLKHKMTNISCVKYPSIIDLDFNNIYWQILSFANVTFYLYGAYYDDRPTTPVIRILAMVNQVTPPAVLCHLWYNSTRNGKTYDHTSKAAYTYMWYNKWGNYKDGILQPFVISCPTLYNATDAIPSSVSLIEECDKQIPTNNLRIVNNRPVKKKDFAVCVKGLDFLDEDISFRLVEWIELLNILGAKKIFIYEFETPPNVLKVLDYYAKKGIVERTSITLPGYQPNLPGLRHHYLRHKIIHKRQNELIPYNDCLYKNLYSYEYIALLDVDEVIMPIRHDNWSDLMQEVVNLSLQTHNDTKDSYNFRNIYFLDDLVDDTNINNELDEAGIPRHLHMLRHVYRLENYTKAGYFVKCFHKVSGVVSLHNHFPINCFGPCTTYSVNTSLAHMQHYRRDCLASPSFVCDNYKNHTVQDTTIWKYKDDLIRRTSVVLSDLKLLKQK